MSSIFEAPPARQRGFWLKIVPAFMAGALVAFAVSQLPMIFYGTPQPTVSSRVPPSGDRQPSGARSEAPNAAVAERSRTLPDATENAPAPPEGRSSQMQAATAPVASSAEGKGCTWPYVDQRCAESDTNSGQAAGEQPTPSVRVISTARNAPTTLETTTGRSTTTVSKPTVSSESKEIGNVAAAGGTSTPSAAAPIRSARKSITEPPRAPQRAAEPAPNGAGRAREPARPKEVRQAGTGQREVRRAKASEQQARTARSHRNYERNDDAASRPEFTDSAVVRTHTLPDGRRLTVYRTLTPRDEVRTVAQGETYRVRRAPLASSYDDDDDEDDDDH